MASRALTHLDARNRPDHGGCGRQGGDAPRGASPRRACACRARWRAALRASGHRTKKGRCSTPRSSPACMAAKRTHELIPFCHPLALEQLPARDRAPARERDRGALRGLGASPHRRGDGGAHRGRGRGAHHLRHVQGAVARHRDHRRAAAGQIRRPARLQRAPATLVSARRWHARRSTAWCSPAAAARAWGATRRRSPTTAAHAARARHGAARRRTWSAPSCRCAPIRRADPLRARFAQIVDTPREPRARSPASWPRRRATRTSPGWCWPATCRCSMRATLAHLCARAPRARIATAYRSSHDGLPEPLCAIYEPAQPRARSRLPSPAGSDCPRKFLMQRGRAAAR